MNEKVLIVDDSKAVRDQVRGILEATGYSVLEASDGQEGVEQIRMNRDLALVICDVHMPNVTGIDMIEMLKAEGLIAKLPVLMLTTEAQRTLIARMKEAGAKGWIVKPFEARHLVAAVNKLVQ